ncbi:MAG TPA: N-acetyltransferase [Rhizomicrobium sp.]|nr:N-acetyltransferase [Rhizomicrobium sp.]
MWIRAEQANDRRAIYDLHAGAFPSNSEAILVDRLREAGDIAISLVAEGNDQILGHVLFSPMKAPFRALGLAPVAVSEKWRRQGIAAQLIEKGLAEAGAASWEGVFVLGEPHYYGRFGFSAELAAGFGSLYSGPYFMALALQAALPHHAGQVDYAPAFATLDF